MKKAILPLIVLVAVAAYALKLVVDAGAFKEMNFHSPGVCRIVPGPVGAEDFAWSPSARRYFIAADHRPEKDGDQTPNGDLWTWDPSREDAPKPSGLKFDFPFHPHGLDVVEAADGTWIHAVNHRGDESVVEIFHWKDGVFTHRRTVSSEHYVLPNDVVSIAPDKFYLTHDHGSKNKFLKMAETYGRFGRGFITYFDGMEARRVAGGIRYANGMQLAPSGDRLYVASMLGLAILVYRRDPATAELTFEREIFLDTAPDNLTWSANDELLVGAHPNLFKLKAKNENHSLKSPAQVLRVSGVSTSDPKLEEVLLDAGENFGAVSVAVETDGKLILGSIYDAGVAICEPSPVN